jgi:hypothetical protein
MSGEQASAVAILVRMAERYAECGSYQDVGELVDVIVNGPKPWQRRTSRKSFQTAFVRPEKLLFEFKERTLGPELEWPHYALWTDAGGVREWSTFLAEETPRTARFDGLASALRSEELLYFGTTCRPARLLLGLDGADTLADVESAEIAGEDEIDGHACWRVAARREGRPETFWIDKQSRLLRRHHERTYFDPTVERVLLPKGAALSLVSKFTTETTTFYSPRADVEIPNSVFAITPP